MAPEIVPYKFESSSHRPEFDLDTRWAVSFKFQVFKILNFKVVQIISTSTIISSIVKSYLDNSDRRARRGDILDCFHPNIRVV